MRLNKSVNVFASSARTATENSSDQTNDCARGVRLFLDITAASGSSPTLDVKVQTKDPVSGNYVALTGAAFAQQTGTATLDLAVYPGIGETANRAVSDVLSSVWRVVATYGGSSPSFTFSVGAEYIT